MNKIDLNIGFARRKMGMDKIVAKSVHLITKNTRSTRKKKSF